MKKSIEFFLKSVCIILLTMLSAIQAWGDDFVVVKKGDLTFQHTTGGCIVTIIPDDSYKYLKNVVIPDTIIVNDTVFYVRHIDRYAFKDCRELESVTFNPECDLIVLSYAFQGCVKLTSLTVPEHTTIIEDAFDGCTGITRLELYGRGNFSCIRNQIREVILGSNRIGIGAAEFYEFRNVKSIVIPEGVTSIGDKAFKSWDSLTRIDLPASLQYIAPQAFNSCYQLDTINVHKDNPYFDSRDGCNAVISTHDNQLVLGCSETVIPQSVTAIGPTAFSNTDVKSIFIPAGVTEISSGAFNYCPQLESIKVSSDNPSYDSRGDSRGDCNAIIDKNTNQLIYGCCKTTIPLTVSGIAPKAFAGVSKKMTMKLPTTFSKVDKQAFHDCTGLTAVYFPSSVSIIDTMAFYGCKNLKSILTETGDEEKFHVPSHISQINLQAFRDCTGLDTLTVPGSLSELGREVWMNCTGLKKVIIEAGIITELPYGTFQNCSNLQEVVLPNIADYKFGNNAFLNCNKIRRVYCTYKYGLPQINAASCLRGETLYVYDVTFEELSPWEEFFSNFIYMTDLNYLVDGIYYNMVTGYMEVTSDQEDETLIPKPYKYSGDIVVPDSVTLFGGTYPVRCIAENAFKGNGNITSITIGKEVMSIDQSAFEDCTRLTRVTMADGKPLGIAPYAFKGCEKLRDITLRDSTVVIGDEAFMNCSAIENVTMPKALCVLGANSFANCTQLRAITIPDSVEIIDEYAFYRCDSLRSVTMNKDVKYINAYAFSYCQKLADITLPETLESIGTSAFLDCRSLTDIALPENTLTLGEGAFRYCYGLKNIQLPKGLKKVGNQVFANCGNLTSIALPEAVTAVGDQAFYQCGNIVSLTIEKGVEKIGQQAFNGCPLVNIYCKPVTPPDVFDNTFSASAYENATLFLPENTDSTYHKHLVWKKFKKGSLSKYELKYVYDDNRLFKKDSINGGAIITPAAIPVKDQRRFSGWRGEPELMPAKDTTIVGAFMYDISFVVKKDGKIVTDKDTVVVDKNVPDSLFYGEKVTAPKSWVEGFGIRWQGLPELMPAKDTVIVGEFVTNKYAVTYIVDGELYRCDSVAYKSKIVPPTMQKENYVFEWGSYPELMPAKDITVYGQFIPQLFADGINIRINKEDHYAEIVKYPNTVISATAVVVPDSVTFEGEQYAVTMIADNAFNGFRQMQSITLPQTLEYIGEQAFRDCQSLTTITIPENVTEISYGTFMYCGKLTEVILHDGVQRIGNHAFNTCGSLTSINLHKVSFIGSEAFANDKQIASIYSDAEEVPVLVANAFESTVYQNATVYADVYILDQFVRDDVWKQFLNFYCGVQLGDVNNDETVDVADVVSVVNHILGDEPDNFIKFVADVNKDGAIDIADIVEIVNIILGTDAVNAPQLVDFLKENGFIF